MAGRVDDRILRVVALAAACALAPICLLVPASASATRQIGVIGSLEVSAAAAAPLPHLSQRRLERATASTLVFGHQSVGENILEGVQALYRSRRSAPPRIVPWTTQAPTVSTGWIAEARVGKNSKPVTKISEFESRLNSMAVSPEVALLKLCYVDVTSKTDGASLFRIYRRAMARLKAAHPHTVILHATVPLKSGDKASNVKRQKYNRLIRGTYPKRRIVDIARVESTSPSGARVRGKLNGKRYYALYRGYTSDGGHLNNEGSQRVAAELIRVVARN